MKRQSQEFETSRLSRSNSFGSLGGLINFVSRLGREDVESDSCSQVSGDVKKAVPRKDATPSENAATEDTKRQRKERSGECTGDAGNARTVALPLSFLFRSNARSESARRPAVPKRQNSTPNMLPSELQLSTCSSEENAEAGVDAPTIATTAAFRRESLFKHNSDSHLHEMIDDEDIDHVVTQKLLLAEAKSEADVAGTQCAELMKKNAYLEHRLVNASSRSEFCIFHIVFDIDIFSLLQQTPLTSTVCVHAPALHSPLCWNVPLLVAELESELQLHTTFARRMSNSKQKIARLEESNRTLQRQLTGSRLNPAATSTASSTTSTRAVPDIGTDLELSIMRRRVQDLERQNRMLRSELVGAGRELDEHRQQSSSSLDVAELHIPDDESSDDDDESTEHVEAAETEIQATDIHGTNEDGDEVDGRDQLPVDILNADDEEETAIHPAQGDNGHEARRRTRNLSASSTEVHIFALGSMSSATTATTTTSAQQSSSRRSFLHRQQQRRASSITAGELPLNDVQEEPGDVDEVEGEEHFGTLQPPADDERPSSRRPSLTRTGSASSTEFHYLRLGSISSVTTTEAAASAPPLLAIDNDSPQQIIDDINNIHPENQDTGNVGGRRSLRRLPAADEVHIFRLGSMASALTTQTDATDSTPLSEVLGH